MVCVYYRMVKVQVPMSKGGHMRRRIVALHLLDSRTMVSLSMSVICSKIWSKVHKS